MHVLQLLQKHQRVLVSLQKSKRACVDTQARDVSMILSAYTEAEFLMSTLFGRSSSFAKTVREGLEEPVGDLVKKLASQNETKKEGIMPGGKHTNSHTEEDISHSCSSLVFPTYLGDQSEVLVQTSEGLQILNGRCAGILKAANAGIYL